MTPFLSCQGEARADAGRERQAAAGSENESGQRAAGSLREKEPWQQKATTALRTKQD